MFAAALALGAVGTTGVAIQMPKPQRQPPPGQEQDKQDTRAQPGSSAPPQPPPSALPQEKRAPSSSAATRGKSASASATRSGKAATSVKDDEDSEGSYSYSESETDTDASYSEEEDGQDEQVRMEDFPPLKNDLLLRAARGEETERAPVWVMRQAGRYLPEFREVRAKHEFFEICRTPALATEITLQPVRRYAGLLDAAIIFSDILVVPQAMGMEVLMNPGPSFPHPLDTPADVSRLRERVDVDAELGYVFKALTRTRKELNGEVPLIGFCGAPWTLFAYMVEGGGSKTFQKAKTWLFKHPKESKALLMRIADVCVDYLVGQAKAGAQLLQIFDSWAGELSPADFATFSLPSLSHIAAGVRTRLARDDIPVPPLTLFAKGANAPASLTACARAGYDVLGLDWGVDPAAVRRIVGDVVALQGNLDPGVLYGGREAIEREVRKMCGAFRGEGGSKGWIANLGHGITPGVDPEDLKFFFECVHKYSAKETPL